MIVVATIAAAIAVIAIAVARMSSHLLVTRHRHRRSSAEARRVRSIGLWAVAAAVVGLVVWYLVG